MNHPISAEEWIDYCDGTLPPAAEIRVEQHLRSCLECREKAQRLRYLEQHWKADGAACSASMAEGLDVETAKVAFLEQLRNGDRISARLARAHLLLAAICGPRVSEQVLKAAAKRASVSSPDRVESHQWPNFVGHLAGIMGSICGQPAAAALSRTLAL